MSPSEATAGITGIERPSPKLFLYYVLVSLLTGPLFPIVILPNYFRYHTLRYRFDDEGVSMRWGILFRREVILNYARIQDIHLSSNLVERWLGLAKLEIQTAAGSSSAEMTIEGLHEFEAIRDFLYDRMRGVKEASVKSAPVSQASAASSLEADLAGTLRAVAEELRGVRLALEKQNHPGGPVNS